MKEDTYQKRLERHLTAYKARRLGINEDGTFVFKGTRREYGHILPKPLAWLNIPEPFRHEVRDYVERHPSIKLHRFFHHLNSSQAFAFSLFLPYLNRAPRALSDALGLHDIDAWEFESVPHLVEGTNVDVHLISGAGISTYCEVKLSEREFGVATNDDRHLRKLESLYEPVLRGLVDHTLFEPEVFFANY